MPLIEVDSEVLIRNGPGPDDFVRVKSTNAANIGQNIVDPILVADEGPVYPGGPFTLTADALNVGEAKATGAGTASFAGLTTASAQGLGEQTPIDQSTKRGAFWSVDDQNVMSEASNSDRTCRIFVGFPTKPSQWRLLAQDAVTCDIQVRVYVRNFLASAYPGTPDITFSVNSDTTNGAVGTQRFVTIDMSVIATAFPAQVRFEYENRGDNSLVSITTQYPEFPQPA